jgi:hypothetical protein
MKVGIIFCGMLVASTFGVSKDTGYATTTKALMKLSLECANIGQFTNLQVNINDIENCFDIIGIRIDEKFHRKVRQWLVKNHPDKHDGSKIHHQASIIVNRLRAFFQTKPQIDHIEEEQQEQKRQMNEKKESEQRQRKEQEKQEKRENEKRQQKKQEEPKTWNDKKQLIVVFYIVMGCTLVWYFTREDSKILK